MHIDRLLNRTMKLHLIRFDSFDPVSLLRVVPGDSASRITVLFVVHSMLFRRSVRERPCAISSHVGWRARSFLPRPQARGSPPPPNRVSASQRALNQCVNVTVNADTDVSAEEAIPANVSAFQVYDAGKTAEYEYSAYLHLPSAQFGVNQRDPPASAALQPLHPYRSSRTDEQVPRSADKRASVTPSHGVKLHTVCLVWT